MLERRQELGGARDLVDLGGEAAHFVGQLGERAVGGHLRGDAAQPDDGAFELLHRGRILRVGSDEIDLARQLAHRRVDADEILGRRQGAQRIANFRQPALDAGAGDVGVVGRPAERKPLGQAANLALQGLDRLPRHRLLEHQADFGEVVAQRLDRCVDAARPQRLDPRGDVAQLLLEVGQSLRRRARQNIGTRRGGRGRPAVGLERALALGDLHQGLLERGRCIGIVGRRRVSEAGAVAIAEAPLDRFTGRASRRDQLVEPAIELPKDVGELARRLFGVQVGPQIGLRRVVARQLIELATDLVEAPPDLGDILGRRAAVMVIVIRVAVAPVAPVHRRRRHHRRRGPARTGSSPSFLA